ncbi:BnaA02g34660D [Brassica napus]|uniref:BnaA02g34660D protein n=1 Tax=Brassica napus TaxID=3708 RepID=A0A078IQG8_BRANA|nr:BnaA02g34660D [Brassica napus]
MDSTQNRYKENRTEAVIQQLFG